MHTYIHPGFHSLFTHLRTHWISSLKPAFHCRLVQWSLNIFHSHFPMYLHSAMTLCSVWQLSQRRTFTLCTALGRPILPSPHCVSLWSLILSRLHNVPTFLFSINNKWINRTIPWLNTLTFQCLAGELNEALCVIPAFTFLLEFSQRKVTQIYLQFSFSFTKNWAGDGYSFNSRFKKVENGFTNLKIQGWHQCLKWFSDCGDENNNAHYQF